MASTQDAIIERLAAIIGHDQDCNLSDNLRRAAFLDFAQHHAREATNMTAIVRDTEGCGADKVG